MARSVSEAARWHLMRLTAKLGTLNDLREINDCMKLCLLFCRYAYQDSEVR